MIQLEEYEHEIIKEIARDEEKPSIVSQALEMAGKPVGAIMELANNSKFGIVQKVTTTVNSAVEEGIKKTITISNTLISEKDVIKEYRKRNVAIESTKDISNQVVPMKVMDEVADSYQYSNALFVGLEGAVMGLATTLAEGIPFAQLAIPAIVAADVSASMIFLSRHINQVATSYGYDSSDPVNIVHLLSAMAPTASTQDEGFLGVKAVVFKEMRDAKQFLLKNAGNMTAEILEKQVPSIVRLITNVAERLGITIVEKELGLLVPIAGSLLNGSVNVLFQQFNHSNAKNYFRRVILEEKYGIEEIKRAIEVEKEKLRAIPV
ncbi:EcsC family protein [Neobacillus sp. Marseille-QA0830]